jgi:hypothetical protein
MNPCRSKKVLIAFGVLGCALVNRAPLLADTNRAEVQANIQKGYEKVVFGKEIDHTTYATTLGALVASVSSGTPAPITAYLNELIAESLGDLAVGMKQEIIREALLHPGKVFGNSKWEISAGFATYEHWKIVKVEVPDRLEIKGLALKVVMKLHTAKIQLPNTHQPYIRLRLRPKD